MQEIVALQEDPESGPGLFALAAEKLDVKVRAIDASRGDQIPRKLPPEASLLVCGGRMPAPEVELCPYLGRWTDLIRWTLDSGQPILGVGTGAHMVAQVLGARIHPASPSELGWGTVTLTAAGIAEPLFAGLPVYLPVFQWHMEDMEPPAGAVLLAASETSPCQAFRHGERTFGLQFHLEATEAMVRAWHETRIGPLADASIVQRLRLLDPFLDREAMARRADLLIRNFLQIQNPHR